MKRILAVVLLLSSHAAGAQVKFSFATDVFGLRNFSPAQKFWAVGQTIQGNFHLSKKHTVYAWLMYASPGRYENVFTATAKDPSTNPNTVPYRMKGLWNLKEVSLGYRHYFRGEFNRDRDWNLYGLAGFGLMFTGIKNTLNSQVDTSLYQLQEAPVIGESQFRRLTLDLALGAELPMGGDFYIYTDVRTYLPASSYPSPYFHSTSHVPLPLFVTLGVRILFGVTD